MQNEEAMILAGKLNHYSNLLGGEVCFTRGVSKRDLAGLHLLNQVMKGQRFGKRLYVLVGIDGAQR